MNTETIEKLRLALNQKLVEAEEGTDARIFYGWREFFEAGNYLGVKIFAEYVRQRKLGNSGILPTFTAENEDRQFIEFANKYSNESNFDEVETQLNRIQSNFKKDVKFFAQIFDELEIGQDRNDPIARFKHFTENIFNKEENRGEENKENASPTEIMPIATSDPEKEKSQAQINPNISQESNGEINIESSDLISQETDDNLSALPPTTPENIEVKPEKEIPQEKISRIDAKNPIDNKINLEHKVQMALPVKEESDQSMTTIPRYRNVVAPKTRAKFKFNFKSPQLGKLRILDQAPQIQRKKQNEQETQGKEQKKDQNLDFANPLLTENNEGSERSEKKKKKSRSGALRALNYTVAGGGILTILTSFMS